MAPDIFRQPWTRFVRFVSGGDKVEDDTGGAGESVFLCDSGQLGLETRVQGDEGASSKLGVVSRGGGGGCREVVCVRGKVDGWNDMKEVLGRGRAMGRV